MSRRPLRYLSLFTGIGGFELGLHKSFPDAECVGFSEVEPFSKSVYNEHFPGRLDLGDISKVDFKQFRGKVDVIFGGSPCQNFSKMSPTRIGLAGEKSKLFFHFLRAVKEIAPKYFVLENIKMSNYSRDRISEYMGVQPVMLDAKMVSAQRRRRHFWCNFPVEELPDEQDLKENSFESAMLPVEEAVNFPVSDTCYNSLHEVVKGGKMRMHKYPIHDTARPKSLTVLAANNFGANTVVDRRFDPPLFRRLQPSEMETLQGLPQGWTSSGKMTKRYKSIGNGVSIPVVTHVFECLKKEIDDSADMMDV